MTSCDINTVEHTQQESNHPAVGERIVVGERRFSVAPMMDWTDRHYRYFARLISKQAILYTEMVTTGAYISAGNHSYLKAKVLKANHQIIVPKDDPSLSS